MITKFDEFPIECDKLAKMRKSILLDYQDQIFYHIISSYFMWLEISKKLIVGRLNIHLLKM